VTTFSLSLLFGFITVFISVVFKKCLRLYEAVFVAKIIHYYPFSLIEIFL